MTALLFQGHGALSLWLPSIPAAGLTLHHRAEGWGLSRRYLIPSAWSLIPEGGSISRCLKVPCFGKVLLLPRVSPGRWMARRPQGSFLPCSNCAQLRLWLVTTQELALLVGDSWGPHSYGYTCLEPLGYQVINQRHKQGPGSQALSLGPRQESAIGLAARSSVFQTPFFPHSHSPPATPQSSFLPVDQQCSVSTNKALPRATAVVSGPGMVWPGSACPRCCQDASWHSPLLGLI